MTSTHLEIFTFPEFSKHITFVAELLARIMPYMVLEVDFRVLADGH